MCGYSRRTTERIKRGGEVKRKYHERLGISVLSVNGQVMMIVREREERRGGR